MHSEREVRIWSNARAVASRPITKKKTRHLSHPPIQHIRPAIDAVARGGRLGEPQEPSVNFHGHPCMALSGWTVKSA
jgi:hypothetical protein